MGKLLLLLLCGTKRRAWRGRVEVRLHLLIRRNDRGRDIEVAKERRRRRSKSARHGRVCAGGRRGGRSAFGRVSRLLCLGWLLLRVGLGLRALRGGSCAPLVGHPLNLSQTSPELRSPAGGHGFELAQLAVDAMHAVLAEFAVNLAKDTLNFALGGRRLRRG